MSNKVSALGKAFGGVIAVFALIGWLRRDERMRGEEARLVYDADPVEEANAAFAGGSRFFYETWHIRRGDKEKAGEWRVPGAHESMGSLLVRFPVRKRLERTWHIELSEESIHFAREATRWADAHNRRMAVLMVRLESAR